MRISRVSKPSLLSFYFRSQLRLPTIYRSFAKDHSKADCHGGEPTAPKPDIEAYFKYHYLEGVERLEKYRPGGYHPVALHDDLNNRYHIVHKLGYGGFSTIWLAKDDKADKYVAIKICVADTGTNPQECEISRRIATSDLILPLVDEFMISGPNGKHQCMVMPLARMSVYAALDSSYHRPFQLPVARAIAAQLIEAIVILHSQGIVHAGALYQQTHIPYFNLTRIRHSPR